MTHLYIFAFIAGAAMALQAGFNAQLGELLNNTQLAAVVAFCASLLLGIVILLSVSSPLPSIATIKNVPIYLWFAGGVLSSLGISIIYFLIPKMGIASMMPYFLIGQLITAIFAGYFGLFDKPTIPFSINKLLGLVLLIAGIMLINKQTS